MTKNYFLGCLTFELCMTSLIMNAKISWLGTYPPSMNINDLNRDTLLATYFKEISPITSIWPLTSHRWQNLMFYRFWLPTSDLWRHACNKFYCRVLTHMIWTWLDLHLRRRSRKTSVHTYKHTHRPTLHTHPLTHTSIFLMLVSSPHTLHVRRWDENG